MVQKKAKRHRLIYKLLLALVSGIVFLFALEMGSYLIKRFEGLESPIEGGYLKQIGQHDHTLFWTLRPNFVDENGRQVTNSHGLRGPEIQPKAPGEFRVLCLGESTTYAPRMSYEQSYSHQLELLLKEGDPDGKVRVINAGVPGYTIFQGYQYLRTRGFDLDPDVVIIYFGYNDFLAVSYLDDLTSGQPGQNSGLTDWELFDKRRTFREKTQNFLLQHSNLYRGLIYGLLKGKRTVEDGEVRTNPSQVRVPPEHRRKILHLFLDSCRERGVDLVVMVPWYRVFVEHAPLLRNFAAKNPVMLVDLLKILPDRLTKPNKTYFFDLAHPRPEGHRLIAEAIYEALSKK